MTSREVGAALRRARRMLTERGEVPHGLIDDLVARSWQRCAEDGLAPVGRLEDAPHFSAAELARNADRQHELITLARPVLEYVFSQTRDSGSMVILADNRGMLLQSLGDANFLSRADRVALSPGTSWHENYRGTNAIGTALIEGIPLVVHGGEHYLERNKFLTCAAAPIAAPDGRILGIIDISGEQKSRHPHTFGLVRAASQMIENKLFEARHGTSLRLRFHPLAEGIGTVAEGVVALSDEGWIIGANQAAMALLNLTTAHLGATPFERAFGLSFDDLLSWSERRPGTQLLIDRPLGKRLFISIEPSKKSIPFSRIQPTPVLPADALTTLDTGDQQMQGAIERLRRVLGKQIPLLIQGESGVGKELFARAGHLSGPRQNKPFIAVNCTALPESLIEAELFGYEPGAYTGARKEGVLGRIRESQGGTLFLDEIGDMPLSLQGRLLRVLQERQVMSLGGGKSYPVDFNLVCASHRDLKSEMEAGRFRADLYYRLNGITLTLPPLRERSDFQFIVSRILDDLAPNAGLRLSAEVMLAFREYSWPGNLRQLANALRTACALLGEHETHIELVHLSEELSKELRILTRDPRKSTLPATENLSILSDAMIKQTVATCGGNMSEAARRLGISRNTLYRRIKTKRKLSS